MARYTGSSCRLCRREGTKLFLKGERCISKKCALERRNYPPGHAGQMRSKMKEYGVQLREKQKVRRIYGVLERQFRGYFAKADRAKGVTGENLLRLLETRLDSVLAKGGFAAGIAQARQLIRHGHYLVNGKKVDIPSFRVKKGDVVEVREKSRNVAAIIGAMEAAGEGRAPEWLGMDRAAMKLSVLDLPAREHVTLPIQEQLIVELYSK
ncbi:MAG: 30S ribosomal protein S4 [Nitrospinae bacterium]|nr:30S ribosomal protein S4 [Nitrospinota bacterium]